MEKYLAEPRRLSDEKHAPERAYRAKIEAFINENINAMAEEVIENIIMPEARKKAREGRYGFYWVGISKNWFIGYTEERDYGPHPGKYCDSSRMHPEIKLIIEKVIDRAPLDLDKKDLFADIRPKLQEAVIRKLKEAGFEVARSGDGFSW